MVDPIATQISELQELDEILLLKNVLFASIDADTKHYEDEV